MFKFLVHDEIMSAMNSLNNKLPHIQRQIDKHILRIGEKFEFFLIVCEEIICFCNELTVLLAH